MTPEMISDPVDEENTHLLVDEAQTETGLQRPTPLPWDQLWILLILQLAEPLTSQVIYPFIAEEIRSLNVAADETQVGHYVGLIESLFYVTQSLTVLHWSRLSDQLGRKPIILLGTFGLSMSMWTFGLSTTFTGLVISRALNGVLNGNIGVMKSVVAEITDSTNMPKAYSYMPISWAFGGFIGPLIGGSLSRPAERYPDLFGKIEFLKTYPYFLPCAVSGAYALMAWCVALVLLKESHSVPTLISRLKACLSHDRDHKRATLSSAGKKAHSQSTGEPHRIRDLLTPPVISAATNYAMLALLNVSFSAIRPVFYSSPPSVGGLGLNPPRIGLIMSLSGILSGVASVLLFAPMNDRLGARNCLRIALTATMVMFASFAVILHLAKASNVTWAYPFLLVHIIGPPVMNLGYGAIFLCIAAASPNRASMGSVNGMCQILVSVTRAIGPAASNTIFALSLKRNWLGGSMLFYALMVINLAGFFLTKSLPARPMSGQHQRT